METNLNFESFRNKHQFNENTQKWAKSISMRMVTHCSQKIFQKRPFLSEISISQKTVICCLLSKYVVRKRRDVSYVFGGSHE